MARNSPPIRALAGVLLSGLILAGPLAAQDLEPRFLAPAPVGMSFVLLGYGYSVGNIVLDPALPIEGTEADVHAISAAYARSIDFFGLAGRISAAVPLAHGTWNGVVAGQDSSTTRKGMGDPLVALEVGLIGAPALRGAEFAGYQRNTVVGASIKVRVPIGQYNDQRYFNLSTGRWQFSPRLGVSQKVGRFNFEGYLSAWFFATNNSFFGGNTVAQDPLMAFQVHAIYQFRRGFWGAVSFGQSFGGDVTVNGVDKDSSQSNNRVGAMLAFPLSRAHTLKGVFSSGITTRAGADFNIFGIAWQYRWGGM